MPIRLSVSRIELRITWGKPLEFVLSLLGFTVGFGNVWRFPYKAYENGGAAFVIAYVTLLVLVGIPLFFLESGIGQFSSRGPVSSCTIVPVCQGVGVGMIINSIILSLYYIFLMVYTCKFIYFSFFSTLPWSECKSWWGADDKCVAQENYTYLVAECDKLNATNFTYKQSSSQQFWQKYILHNKFGSNLNNLGSFCPELALVLFGNWTVTYLCIVGGIKTSGKVVYFTSLFPYIVLFAIGAFALSLDGAFDGLLYLFVPNVEKLLHVQVWLQSATQLLFSLGLGTGSVIMYASFNQFNSRLQRYVLILTLIDLCTSILASTLVFSTIGHIAHQLNITVHDAVDPGPGLMFITVSGALTMLPVPQLWSLLFFLMLFTIGINSQFVLVETILLTVTDHIVIARKHNYSTCCVICLLGCVAGFPLCTEGGFYIFDFLSSYGHDVGFLFSNLALIITVMYFYGFQKFSEDMEFMLNYDAPLHFWYWKLCWVLFTPLVLLALLAYSIAFMKNTDLDGRELLEYMVPIKWILVMAAPSMTPLFVIIVLIKYRRREGGIWSAFQRNPKWGPADLTTKTAYLAWKRHGAAARRNESRSDFWWWVDYVLRRNCPASMSPVPSFIVDQSEESKAKIEFEYGDSSTLKDYKK